MIELYR